MTIENPYPSVEGPLSTALITLAASPEYLPTIEAQLTAIVRQTVDRVAAADFVSMTGAGQRPAVTVAVREELIRAVDEIETGTDPIPGDGVVDWPGFPEEAPRLGLHSSVSVPLHTGSGQPLAVLTVYGRDPAAMAPLIGGVCTVRGLVLPNAPELTDQGGRELVAGYAEALAVRDRIHRALAIIMAEDSGTADDAYVTLCIHAAHHGTDLATAATTFLPATGQPG